LSVEFAAEDGRMLLEDMDLCCLIDSDQPPLNASDLVTMVGDLLERGVQSPARIFRIPIDRVP
jgi:terminal uridylyltransferase